MPAVVRSAAPADTLALAEALPEIVWTATADGLVDYVNGRGVAYAGIPAERLLGWGWQAIVHPEDWPRSLDLWAAAVVARTPLEVEYRLRRADGAWRWHLARAVPAASGGEGGSGRVRWFGVCTDIDEQKRAVDARHRAAARALQESEARFQAFMDHSPLVAWLKDAAGRYVYVNRTYEASFGVSLDAIVGRTDEDLFAPGVARRLRQHDAEVLASGQSLEAMESVPTPDGIARTWLVLKFPMEDPTGGRCVGGTALDVTERVRQEEAVRRADARFRAASESSLDAFIMLGAVRGAGDGIEDFAFTDLNARAASLIGRERLDLVGRRVGDVLPWCQAAELFEAYVRVTNGGGPVEEEFTLALPGFAGRWFHHQVVQLGDGVAITVRETTIRRRADAAMRQAKEAAEAANRAKSDFLARMSHELRTPLNSVIGFSGVLRARRAATAGGADAQEERLLERIGANGRHLLGLINDILDLSKVEAGRLQLEIVPVRVDDLLAEVAAGLEPRAAERGVRMTLRRPPRVASVGADETRLRQVLLNLVGNAVKFTERGVVRLTLETDPDTGRPRRVEIADTGIGIPAERQGAIFQAFEQAEVGTTRNFGGTGLGLTISRALCDAMGYRLELTRSAPGQGSVFSLYLP